MKIKFLVIIVGFLSLSVLTYFIYSKQSPKINAEEPKPNENTEEVSINKDKQKSAGIKIWQVKRDKLEETLEANGVLEADPARLVKVTSRVGGKVLKVLVNTGDRVYKGQPLIIIDSIEIAEANENYLQTKAKAELSKKNLERQKKMIKLGLYSKKPMEDAGNKLAEDRAEFVSSSSNFDMANKNFQRIKELFEEGITSGKQLDQAQTEYEIAKAQLEKNKAKFEISKNYYERENKIYNMNLFNRQELENAENEYQRALIEFNGAKNKVNILGQASTGRFYINAPQSGILLERDVSTGEAVDPSKTLLIILDTSRLWAIISVYEKDGDKIKEGSFCNIKINSIHNRIFSGYISYISPVLDIKSRTLKVRVELNNTDSVLKPEMFISALIKLSSKNAVIIPKEAVQQQESKDVVYLFNEPDKFLSRQVKIGSETELYYEVVEGLKEGDKIASSGSFNIKSELLKNTLEEE